MCNRRFWLALVVIALFTALYAAAIVHTVSVLTKPLRNTDSTAVLYVPSQKVTRILADQVALHEAAIAREKAASWDRLVSKVAEKTFITSDRALAERVTNALANSCAEFGVDPWVMASLIAVESGGNPLARSKVGALGLAQIMPPTGKYIAKDLGVKWTGPEMLLDVETNIRFATYYMHRLLGRFDGNLHAALAAYNWGPTKIARRLARGEALPKRYPTKVISSVENDLAWL